MAILGDRDFFEQFLAEFYLFFAKKWLNFRNLEGNKLLTSFLLYWMRNI